MMRPSLHLTVFLLSCAVFSAGGWWLAFSRPAALAAAGAAAAGRMGSAVSPGEEMDGDVPLTQDDIRRQMVSRLRTEDLWRWFLSGLDPRNSGDEFIMEELVDRLGWTAWDQALALEDPMVRMVATNGLLACLAKRDPWRAFEVWRDHREEFGRDGADSGLVASSGLDFDSAAGSASGWGSEAMRRALEGIGQASAPQMIEMLSAFRDFGSFPFCLPEYAHGFDFGAVVDFLIRDDNQRLQAWPDNLLTGWSRQSPVAASEWILAHAGTLGDRESWSYQIGSTLREIAGMAPGTPGRAEALEVLSRLPERQLDNVWGGYSPETRGTLPLPEFEAAEAMGRKEAFLWGAFFTTRESDTLDPSWQQLSSADRQLLLEKMAEWRGPEDQLTTVQKESWQRWRKMVTTAWGMKE